MLLCSCQRVERVSEAERSGAFPFAWDAGGRRGLDRERSRMVPTIPRDVARKLGYYVYLYVDPRTGKPFYVGKGKGERVLSHFGEVGESRKLEVLKELQTEGREPMLEVLAHGLPNGETAFRIEAAVIDLLGLKDLTNSVRGWKSIQLGRMPLNQLVGYYAAKPIEITDPAILIRVNRLYRHAMSEEELYDVTRSIWKVGDRKSRAKYALAVFEGVVREVYEIEKWHPAGTTEYKTRALENGNAASRSWYARQRSLARRSG